MILRSALAFFIISICTYSLRAQTWLDKVDDNLRTELNSHEVIDCIVFLENQSIKSLGDRYTKEEKAIEVHRILSTHAYEKQKSLLSYLEANDIFYQCFYLVNCVRIKCKVEQLTDIAKRKDILRLSLNGDIFLEEPVEEPKEEQIIDTRMAEPEWGIQMILADSVWSLGYRGEGVVIGGQDTGFDWENTLIQSKYRGYHEIKSDHNYNWHDAISEISPLHNDSIVDPSNNPCGLLSEVPCDDHGHGSHTMGTMVGEDSENSIGVALDAQWIACRNMERGYGKPSTYLECFEWFLAPTDLNGENADPTKAPHVINNSWSCPKMEGCDSTNWYMMEIAVNNLKASGVVVVVSAGNSGSQGCGSISTPAAMLENSFTVGATASNDTIAAFSSRGLVVVDSSFIMKPNVTAPGVGIRSIRLNNEFATWSGTSMAGPHVAGVVALMISANPSIAGNVEAIETILETTAIQKITNKECHGVPGTSIPNPVYGYGRINAWAAVQSALAYVSNTQDINQENPVLVSPNPFRNRIDIKIISGQFEEDILLFDVQGKLVIRARPGNQKNLSIDTSTLNAGIYFLRTIVNGQVFNKKIIKQ